MAEPALKVHVLSDEESEAAAAKKRARLDEIAKDLRKIHKRIEGDTLALGKLLAEVLDRNLLKAKPDYDHERWGKLPNGQLEAVTQWYRAEVGPISLPHAGKVIQAARVAEVISRAGEMAPRSETQVRPLVRVHKADGRKVAPAWERACELAEEHPGQRAPRGQPTGPQVAKAAREVCPEAFKPKQPKRHLKAVPGTTVRKRKDKAGAKAALAELLEQFDRKVLEAAWNELQ